MQNDKKNGIAFGMETGNPSPTVREACRKMLQHYKEISEKKQERKKWIDAHWKVIGGKAYCESSDERYKTTIEVSVEIDPNGFKTLVVTVDKEETTPHGSWTTTDIPVEILEQLLK